MHQNFAKMKAKKADCLNKTIVKGCVAAAKRQLEKPEYEENLSYLESFAAKYDFDKFCEDVEAYVTHRDTGGCGGAFAASTAATPASLSSSSSSSSAPTSFSLSLAQQEELDAFFPNADQNLTAIDVLLSFTLRNQPLVLGRELVEAADGKAHLIISSPHLLSRARTQHLLPGAPKIAATKTSSVRPTRKASASASWP
jgi:hypothetical protein